jgi:hypothetical protein
MDSPAHGQAGDDKHGSGDHLGEEVGHHATRKDRGARDGKRTESVDETGRHVGRDSDGGALGRSDQGHPEHAADEVLVIVVSAGKSNG